MIHLLCALPCEARPLLDCHDLRHVPQADIFKCYASRDGGISLTISNPDKINAAAAVCYTYTFFNSLPGDAWLNIGTAGHHSLALGVPALAHSIEDAGSGLRWYPQFVAEPPCRTLHLKTLDRPSTEYEESMVDMEAAGFYATASRFGTAELIYVLKIISDNAAHPAGKPDAEVISGFIQEQLPCINNIIESLRALSAELATIQQPPPAYSDCVARWHFTEYERNVLLRLLQRWQLLCPDRHPLADSSRIKKGKELNQYLEKELNRVTISFAE